MDKVKNYHRIVGKMVDTLAERDKDASSMPHTTRIVDPLTGHYLLYKIDWVDEYRHYGCFLHLEVHPSGKVWVHHDGTDVVVVQQLLDAGIPKEDIVLGFRAPIIRPDTGFAVGNETFAGSAR